MRFFSRHRFFVRNLLRDLSVHTFAQVGGRGQLRQSAQFQNIGAQQRVLVVVGARAIGARFQMRRDIGGQVGIDMERQKFAAFFARNVHNGESESGEKLLNRVIFTTATARKRTNL